MLELRHRRALDKVTIDSIQISPRLFEPREVTKPTYGFLPVLFRLPNTWTLRITVPSPLNYTLATVSTTSALSVFERIQNRAFYSVQQLLTTHANQTLWGAHLVNTWNDDRVRYQKTDTGRTGIWNQRGAESTDSGNNSVRDADFSQSETDG